MASELQKIFSELSPDPWRIEVGYSPELAETQNSLLTDSNERAEILSSWLQRHQPCLFGRVAAKQKLIRYCFLEENDLTGDDAIRDKIQAARLKWTRDAFEGRASGFVILFVSQTLADALPDATVLKFAIRLCELYLREVDVRPDAILHERVCLEKPGERRMTWEWLAGVNYFSAHGDLRWWADHRIPGGLGFSVNSVGHMVKAGKIGEHMHELAKEIELNESEFGGGTIHSLSDALKYAMLTIDNASEAASGKATKLLAFSEEEDLLPCPIELPSKIADKNHCTYSGWYHTDYTIPSEYFRPNVTRPAEIRGHLLDFTYLFADDVGNPAHEAMGIGHRIRGTAADEVDYPLDKQGRMIPREVEIGSNAILSSALGDYWK